MIVKKKIIVGVVTDGCTGTHPKLENNCNSSNEIGAKLLASLVSRAAHTMPSTGPYPLTLQLKISEDSPEHTFHDADLTLSPMLQNEKCSRSIF